jgi:TonB family protein
MKNDCKHNRFPIVRENPVCRIKVMPQTPGFLISRSIFIVVIAGIILAATNVASARRKVPLGTHIPRIDNLFMLPDAVYRSLFVGTTPAGRMLSYPEIAPLVVQARWPKNFISTRTNWRFKIGVFLLHVRPDGTVSDVETLQSIGHPTANSDSIRAFKQWRFRPNSVKAVRIPTYYTRV